MASKYVRATLGSGKLMERNDEGGAMARLPVATVAVGIALLLTLAGVVVTIPVADAATPGDRSPALDRGQLGCDGVDALASVASHTTPDDSARAYRELSTCGVSGSRSVGSSRDERASEVDDRSERQLHRWHCPVCGATKTSFSTPGRDTVEEAANNLRSHLRTTDGEGHGPPGTVPSGFDAADLAEYVTVFELAD